MHGPQWICCQIGAREHYAIPRTLHAQNELALLITDAWAHNRLPWNLAPGSRASARASERHHPAIPPSLVASFDWPLARFELSARLRPPGWPRTMARNQWFQLRALARLRRFRDRHPARQFVLYSYSYAADQLFAFAKESGWSTVLGQIDPGPFEEKIVTNLQGASHLASPPAPKAYWEQWRNECRLADRIIVNSEWSRHALQSEGIDPNKLDVAPLGYDPPSEAANFIRRYPPAFTAARPLRILFLGQINIRKGVAAILDAMPQLATLPVEFRMVGDVQLPVPPEYKQHPRILWFGAIPRAATASFYRDADVFLFPTFSDGFGLTQLEAQAWRLPIIASQNCGDVVQHGVNGYILPEITADAIARAIKHVLAAPSALQGYATRSRHQDFTLSRIHQRLIGSVAETISC